MRCVKGVVLDVAVDIRKGSPTFGQHVSCLLTGRDEEGMKIAEQFAKESVISNQSSVNSHQFEKAILSEKDLKHACLKDAVLDFDINDKLYDND